MIDIKLKYQFSIFLNASDLNATPKNISELMNEFMDKGFIPNTFQEISSLNPTPQNRFKLQSPSGEWSVMLGSSRIDIEQNPTNLKGSNLISSKQFSTEAKDIIIRILTKFPRKGNRLSIVSRCLFNEMSNDQLNKVYGRLFNSPPLYVNNTPFEWNWRAVAKINKNIMANNEEFNFVTTINRINGEIRNGNEVSVVDRIELGLDLNSIAQNYDNRFGVEEIDFFMDNAYLWHNELQEEIINFIKK